MIPTIALIVFAQASPIVLSWPLEGLITSGYGPRWGQLHRGIDIRAIEGTWVRSAADGLVVWAGEYKSYGNLVAVRHADGVKTFYAHLQNFCVFKGQKIKQGQKVGRVGITGKTTGPHLHFQVLLNMKSQDPLSLLPPQLLASTPDKGERVVGGP